MKPFLCRFLSPSRTLLWRLVFDLFYSTEVKASPCPENWDCAEEFVSPNKKNPPSLWCMSSLAHLTDPSHPLLLRSFRIAVIRCGWLAAPCRAVILIRDVFLYGWWSWSGRLLLLPGPPFIHPSIHPEPRSTAGVWTLGSVSIFKPSRPW